MNKDLEKVFKALADSTRLEIIMYLSEAKEMPCQDLMKKFSLSQPTLSHHFNKLVDAKVLNARKEGVLWFYSINSIYLKKLGLDFHKLYNIKG